MKRALLLALCFTMAGTISAMAEVVNFDFSTPVVTGAQAPGVWYPDRAAPNGFVSQQTAPDSTPNTLQETIDPVDYNPTGYYDTQGRKYDLPAGLVSADVSVYVPSAWASQDAREAGFWATGVDGSSNVSDYPIIEFQGAITQGDYQNNGVAGFYGWNNTGAGSWDLIATAGPNFSYNSWVNLSMSLTGTGILYEAGNTSILSPYGDSGDPSLSLANVMLQGYDGSAGTPPLGSAYSIYWNNLSASDTPAPEPGTIVLMVGGLSMLLLMRFRARAKSQQA